MGLSHSPQIVTDSLVLFLDAGNKRSYPESGTVWTDLSGQGNNGTLINSPTFNTSNLGIINFDGLNDYIDLGSFFTFQNFTISTWLKCGSTQVEYANIFDNNHTGIRNFVFQQISTNTNQYVCGVNDSIGAISVVEGINLPNNIWTNITISFTPSDRLKIYINNVLYSQGSLANNRNILYQSQNLYISKWGGGTNRNWNGSVSNFFAYNRVLSEDEIKQNFNALRGRYGI